MKRKNDKEETIMQMYILAHMMKEVGRYISFQKLNEYPLEEQYQLVMKIDCYIKGHKK